jgi:hypothetical protein
LLFISGHVTGNLIGNGRCLVDMAQEARNQSGELSIVGGGTVTLRG